MALRLVMWKSGISKSERLVTSFIWAMATAMEQTYEIYRIVSVRRAEPPSGAEGSDWHRYVIAQGSSTITGYRRGSLKTVTTVVEEFVAKLNERRLNNRGRVHLPMTPRKKAPN